jgi:Bacterial sugar transferase
MRYRKPHNHSLRHPPRVPAGRGPSPAPATASHTPAASPLRPPRRPPHGSPRIPPTGPGGAGSDGRADLAVALVSAAWFAGIVGGLWLAIDPAAAYRVLVAGLVLAVAAILLRHPGVADRAVAALLGLMLLPLLLLIGLAVRLTSPGPALVRQAGVGPAGRSTVVRFRTTFVSAETPSGQPDDTRPTPIGRILHRWYLDEVPGVLSVLRGEVSLFRPGPP